MTRSVVTCLVVALIVGFPSLSAEALTGGAARREITPPVGGAMYGYSARGAAVSVGVHDPLLARALVLRSEENHVALITLDLGGISRESMQVVRDAVKKSAGLENLLFAVSHSHSS